MIMLRENGFEALRDLHKYLEVWNEKENRRMLIYKVMHQGSEIYPDKHTEQLKLAIMFLLGEVLEETKSIIFSSF